MEDDAGYDDGFFIRWVMFCHYTSFNNVKLMQTLKEIGREYRWQGLVTRSVRRLLFKSIWHEDWGGSVVCVCVSVRVYICEYGE